MLFRSYELDDTDTAIKQIQYLFDNEDIRKRLGANARKYIEDEFSLKVVGTQFKKILEETNKL